MNSEKQDITTEDLPADLGLLVEELPSINLLNEFYRANGWDADYRQLTPGPLRVQIAGRLVGDISLFRECYGRRIATLSQTPEEVVSVLIPLSNEAITVSGYEVTAGTFLVLSPGAAVNIAAPKGGDGATIDIPEAMFREFLQAVTGRDSLAPEAQIAAFKPGSHRLARLRRTVKGLLSGASHQAFDDVDDAKIVTRLCRLLHDPASVPIGGDPYRRISKDRVLGRAKDYIHAHLADDIRVPDLCQYSGTSLSTLERAFKQEIGVTPHEYIRAARLHDARNHLRNDDMSHLAVADIALNCGFTHMGRFAQQYHGHFGVLPSQDRATAHPRL